MNENKENKLTCEHCDSLDWDYQENPYIMGMTGNSEIERICPDCYRDLVQGV